MKLSVMGDRDLLSRPSRWRALALTSGLLGVALVLVLSPLAGATASGTAVVTVKAPFTGATGYASSSLSNAGCAVAKIVRAPFFNPTNGRAGFSVSAHGSLCAGLSGDSGYAAASETATVPIPVHNGTNHIHAKWTLNGSLGARLTGGACTLSNTTFSYCYVDASASLYAFAYLIDTTNSSYYFGATTFVGVSAISSIYDSCYLGNCTSNVTGNSHVALNTIVGFQVTAKGLVASHTYVLQVSWYSSADVYDYTYDGTLGPTTESASVTMAGPGMGIHLNWITIR